MRASYFVLTLILILASSRHTSADAPPLVPVQGYLTDVAGAPLDGTFNIRFRLYPSSSGGTPLLEETPSVVVTGGRFVHYLGTEDALDLAIFRDYSSLYLGLRIGNDTEATPLVELGSIPFAAYSQYCGDASTVGGETLASLRDYASLSGVPATFTPAPHNHTLADVADAQSVLEAACPVGSSLRAISPTGAIACETDDDSLYTAGVGIVVNPDRSIALSDTVVQDRCFDTEAELHALLDSDYAALGHTHAASSLIGSFANLTATGTVTADGITANSGTFTSGVSASAVNVSGAVAAGSFVLAVPRQGRKFVPAGTFLAGPGNASLFTVSDAYRASLYTILQAAFASAPVELPHGAVVSRITCFVTDNNATYDFTQLRAFLTRRGNPSYSSATSVGSGPIATTSGTVDSAPVNWSLSHTVDAMSYVYSVGFSWLGTTAAATQAGYFHGCEVIYSTSSL